MGGNFSSGQQNDLDNGICPVCSGKASKRAEDHGMMAYCYSAGQYLYTCNTPPCYDRIFHTPNDPSKSIVTCHIHGHI